MKWYFALSGSSIDRNDHDWLDLVRVSVRTALQNTSLVPHMLFDGDPCDFTDEMTSAGVKVIFHRVSFDDALEAFNPHEWYLPIMRGCFLRVEIPLIETEDDYVLYTDCDVMFLKDIIIEQKPEYFAACSERHKDDYSDLNSGVMLLNIRTMRECLPEFTQFIRDNITTSTSDQPLYAAFFANKYESLNPQYNWKPYWGVADEPKILHWHGPKPVIVQKILENPAIGTAPIWKELVMEDPTGYRFYLEAWDKQIAAIRADA